VVAFKGHVLDITNQWLHGCSGSCPVKIKSGHPSRAWWLPIILAAWMWCIATADILYRLDVSNPNAADALLSRLAWISLPFDFVLGGAGLIQMIRLFRHFRAHPPKYFPGRISK
jgi:hypothetical protein